jgi:hypothetical protein
MAWSSFGRAMEWLVFRGILLGKLSSLAEVGKVGWLFKNREKVTFNMRRLARLLNGITASYCLGTIGICGLILFSDPRFASHLEQESTASMRPDAFMRRHNRFPHLESREWCGRSTPESGGSPQGVLEFGALLTTFRPTDYRR